MDTFCKSVASVVLLEPFTLIMQGMDITVGQRIGDHHESSTKLSSVEGADDMTEAPKESRENVYWERR